MEQTGVYRLRLTSVIVSTMHRGSCSSRIASMRRSAPVRLATHCVAATAACVSCEAGSAAAEAAVMSYSQKTSPCRSWLPLGEHVPLPAGSAGAAVCCCSKACRVRLIPDPVQDVVALCSPALLDLFHLQLSKAVLQQSRALQASLSSHQDSTRTTSDHMHADDPVRIQAYKVSGNEWRQKHCGIAVLAVREAAAQ